MGIDMTTTTAITGTKFIDIHSHILFNADDGAYDLNESLILLKQKQKLHPLCY